MWKAPPAGVTDHNPQECPAPYANEGLLPAILKAPPSVRHWATPAAAMKAPPPVLRLSPSPPAVLRLSPAPPTTKAPPPEYVPISDQARVVVYSQFVRVYPYTPVPQRQRNADTLLTVTDHNPQEGPAQPRTKAPPPQFQALFPMMEAAPATTSFYISIQ